MDYPPENRRGLKIGEGLESVCMTRENGLKLMSYGGTHVVSTFDVHIAKRFIATIMAPTHIRVDHERHIAARAGHTDIIFLSMNKPAMLLMRLTSQRLDL